MHANSARGSSEQNPKLWVNSIYNWPKTQTTSEMRWNFGGLSLSPTLSL
jgi:hypothetical protein